MSNSQFKNEERGMGSGGSRPWDGGPIGASSQGNINTKLDKPPINREGITGHPSSCVGKRVERSKTEQVADVMDTLHQVFPNGHQDFITVTMDEIELHSLKNADYAGVGSDPLGNFRRTESIKRLYPGLDWASDYGGAIDYMLKQFDAVMWNLSRQKDTSCESLDDKIKDISVYAKLVRIMLQAVEKKKKVERLLISGKRLTPFSGD